MDEDKQRFLEIFNTTIKRDGADKLLVWLQNSDFFYAPASSRFHGNHKGGLLRHCLNVYEALKTNVKRYKLEVSEETIAICALLHDICKVNFYKPEWKNKKIYKEDGSKYDDGGRFEWEVIQGYIIDDSLPLGHGEKSVIILQGFIKLNRDEIYSIRWHMGGFDNSVKGGEYGLGVAWEISPLAFLTHISDLEASYMMGERKI